MKDPQIRELLRPFFVEGVYIEELPCGGSRADVVHVCPQGLHCYEIKSDGDNLKLAASQMADYAQAFDHVSFVITERHLQKLTAMLPVWVGLIIATAEGLNVIRQALPNPVQSRGGLMGLLPADSVKHFLKARGEVGHSKKRVWELFGLLNCLEHIDIKEIDAYVRKSLCEHLPDRMRKREVGKTFKATEKERAAKTAAADELAKAQKAWWHVDGFPSYVYDANAGTLLKMAGFDAAGHARPARIIKASTNEKSGSTGWRLRRNGCNIWVGQKAMVELLRPSL